MRNAFLLLAVLCAVSASTARAAEKPQHVRATLLADVKQIVPGKPFHLGVLLNIDKGWHVYWLNPGDSGEATKIKLELPKGFTAGEVQFPTPRLIVDPGNIKVYGYTDSVMFIATVTPDKSIAPGDADLSAKVTYLVCKDVCIPGHVTPELKLPVITKGTPIESANGNLFENWTDQVPRTTNDSGFLVQGMTLEYHPADHIVKLSIGVRGPRASLPTVFPGSSEDVDVKADVSGTFDTIVYKKPTGVFVTLHVNVLAGHSMPDGNLPVVLGFEEKDMNNRDVDKRYGIVLNIDLGKLRSPDRAAKQ